MTEKVGKKENVITKLCVKAAVYHALRIIN